MPSVLEVLRERQEEFAKTLDFYGYDSIAFALRAGGNWYDRRPLKNWQLDVLRKELEKRRNLGPSHFLELAKKAEDAGKPDLAYSYRSEAREVERALNPAPDRHAR